MSKENSHALDNREEMAIVAQKRSCAGRHGIVRVAQTAYKRLGCFWDIVKFDLINLFEDWFEGD
jgi:hypothetical protein